MFNSKYPIICAPMNRVSDLRLAIACASAGIVPSLIPYPDFKLFLKNLEEYKNTGKELMVAINLEHVLHHKLYEKILNSCITHIELIEYNHTDLTDANIAKIQLLRANGIKIILKILRHNQAAIFLQVIDGVTIKGSDGAGRSLAAIDLVEEVKKIKELYPELAVIASGGVKDKQDIDRLISAGACAVSLGTVFAMSAESSVPESTKKILLEKTTADITRISQGQYQRAILFDTQKFNDDENNTMGLEHGIKTGATGHIFMGNAIDSITEIISVADIVHHLTS